MIDKIMAMFGYTRTEYYETAKAERLMLFRKLKALGETSQALRQAVQLHYDTHSPEHNDYLLDVALGEYDEAAGNDHIA